MNRKIVPWIITAVGLAGAAALAPNIAANYSDMSGRRQLVANNETDIQQALVEHDQIVARQDLAEQRYKLGCLLIMHIESNSYVNLNENMVIVDPVTLDPLPKDILVCDPYGNIGLTNEDGRVRSIVFTPNTEIVQAARERAEKSQSIRRAVMPNLVKSEAQ